MEAAIVVTVNLPGVLSGSVKHTTKQVGKVDVSPIGSKNPEWITRKIKHTDRVPVPCARIVPIAAEIVTAWVKSEVPYWIKPQVWKKFNKKQKIEAHLSRFDEGYGVSYK
jgi:hypothetical protein